jgi:glycosyltransferase involved in cell wall biosynthesis
VEMPQGMRSQVRSLHLLKATGIAGAETHLLALLPALRERDVECALVIMEDPQRPQTDFAARAEAAGVATLRIPIRSHIDVSVVQRIRRAISELEGRVSDASFDLLHAHLPHAELYGERATRAFPGMHFIISRHNDDRFRRWPLLRPVFAPSLRRAERILAISRAIAGTMVSLEGVPREKIEVVHYGLEGEGFASQAVPGRLREELGLQDEPLIGFVGRMVEQKGVDVLLRAFVDVRRALPEAHLALIGDGRQMAAMLSLARSLRLSKFHFLGWRTDVPDILADIDVLAMPSRWEGFGLVALQAMAMARPVVASRVSALPEIVEHQITGMLVPPENARALARALLDVLHLPEHGAALGRAGRARQAREFTLDRMAEATARLYREVCIEPRR